MIVSNDMGGSHYSAGSHFAGLKADQIRMFFSVYGIYAMMSQCHTQTKFISAHQDEHGKDIAGKWTTVVVTRETRRNLLQLFALLSAAISLAFARTNFVSSAERFQALLQSYCIFFAKQFPDSEPTPTMHICLHVLNDWMKHGKITNFYFESAVGDLGGVQTNGKHIERTVAFKWCDIELNFHS